MTTGLLSKRSMSIPDSDTRQTLLKAVKKEVKQIMEEAVTRKFVHEESSSITSLCGAVEACLLHGLRKRALGLFKFSNTTALLQKVSKSFDPAMQVVRLVNDIETNNDPSRKSLDTNKNQTKRQTSISFSPKYLWLRVAIFEKQLAKILDYLVQNNSKYYESWALISDPVDGPILASLLVGPCALDYTKMKTSDHFWTDPPADELVQRHRIHSGGHHMTSGAGSPGSPRRPGLQIRRNASSSSEESSKNIHISAREYVESLHQNSRSTLLYGKNNVLVQPKEGVEALQGYLSLHQTVDGLTIMWTPNQLMNGCCEETQEDLDRSHYWDFALTIFLDEIVYIHCHQQPDCRGTIVLVGQDGVQRPPIHFPKGGHLLAFLSCLETGLLPHGQLDPPLWSQRGKGKVFPKLKRKGSRLSNLSTSSKEGSTSSTSSSTDMEDEATDYVFRIVKVFKPENIPPEVLDPKAKFRPADLLPWALNRLPRGPSPLARSDVQTYAKVQEEQNNTCITKLGSGQNKQGNTIKQLCDTMRRQIISRAFYGWLAHCRHLKTVRTHLSGLVHHRIFPVDQPHDASKGLTTEVWREMVRTGTVTGYPEVFRLVYYGGIEHGIRKEVWPYLLGHYKFDSTQEEREYLDKKTHDLYEKTMSEWLAVEAIVKQRERENMAANLAKMSSESTDGNIPLVRKDSSLDNDVFLSQSFDSDEFSHPETVPEESSATGTTCCTPDRKQSMDLHFELSDKITQTDACPLIEKREYLTSYTDSPDDGLGDSIARQSSQERNKLDSAGDSESTDISKTDREGSIERGVGGTKMSIESSGLEEDENEADDEGDDEEDMEQDEEDGDMSTVEEGDQPTVTLTVEDSAPALDDRTRHLSTSKESLMSPASPASNGGVYSQELLDNVALNLHRIDKDVQRCDRNYWYFTHENLEKLRNIMCTYVWEHLDVGYVQGMCDLLAPLLVIIDEESKTYSCFCELMKRMSSNFPHGGAMDTHFANMRSLIQEMVRGVNIRIMEEEYFVDGQAKCRIYSLNKAVDTTFCSPNDDLYYPFSENKGTDQMRSYCAYAYGWFSHIRILDSELFEHMHHHGDYTHFYFCYRWFLLDFKRELVYDDIFVVWETIWAAKHISSAHFVLFIALALVEYYRDIILDNNMDFTDIIKFFNEMAERHDAKQVLKIARELILRQQTLIDNK